MRPWRTWLLVAALVAAAGALTAGGHGQGAAAAGAGDAAFQSAALASAPDLQALDGAELDGAGAAVAAAGLAARVPVPAGGNFNGIRWAELDGTIGAKDVQVVVEYNAACQWYRALRDGRQTDEARRVIADIPRWQATRAGGATGELAAGVAADVAAGGGDTLTGVLRDCDAAHRREVAFADAGGKPGER